VLHKFFKYALVVILAIGVLVVAQTAMAQEITIDSFESSYGDDAHLQVNNTLLDVQIPFSNFHFQIVQSEDGLKCIITGGGTVDPQYTVENNNETVHDEFYPGWHGIVFNPVEIIDGAFGITVSEIPNWQTHENHWFSIGGTVSGCVNCPPPVDVCPNIDGLQEEIPEGMEIVDGECVEPEEHEEIVDICPNLPGAQPNMPRGYEYDSDGSCVQNVLHQLEVSCPQDRFDANDTRYLELFWFKGDLVEPFNYNDSWFEIYNAGYNVDGYSPNVFHVYTWNGHRNDWGLFAYDNREPERSVTLQLNPDFVKNVDWKNCWMIERQPEEDNGDDNCPTCPDTALCEGVGITRYWSAGRNGYRYQVIKADGTPAIRDLTLEQAYVEFGSEMTPYEACGGTCMNAGRTRTNSETQKQEVMFGYGDNVTEAKNLFLSMGYDDVTAQQMAVKLMQKFDHQRTMVNASLDNIWVVVSDLLPQ
jgi:hypothetical protein